MFNFFGNACTGRLAKIVRLATLRSKWLNRYLRHPSQAANFQQPLRLSLLGASRKLGVRIEDRGASNQVTRSSLLIPHSSLLRQAPPFGWIVSLAGQLLLLPRIGLTLPITSFDPNGHATLESFDYQAEKSGCSGYKASRQASDAGGNVLSFASSALATSAKTELTFDVPLATLTVGHSSWQTTLTGTLSRMTPA